MAGIYYKVGSTLESKAGSQEIISISALSLAWNPRNDFKFDSCDSSGFLEQQVYEYARKSFAS